MGNAMRPRWRRNHKSQSVFALRGPVSLPELTSLG